MSKKNKVTQKYLDEHPELVEEGLKVGDILPDELEGDGKIISISEGKLANILKGIEKKLEGKFLGEIDELKKNNAILFEAADKTLLGKVLNKNQKSKGMSVMLSRVNGKVVVGWRMIMDVVEKNSNGIWTEKQVIEVTLEDDSKVEMPYMAFTNAISADRLKANVISRSVDEDENITYKVKAENGKEYSIASPFVN